MVLSNSCIAQTVEEVEAFFESSGISGEDQIRLRLLIENALLTYQSCLGEDAEFEIFFRKAGMHKAVFRIRGDRIDPFKDVQDNDDYPDTIFLKNLFAMGTAKASWSYHGGYNVITANALAGEKAIKIPGGAVTVAAILVFFAALITKGLPSPVFMISFLTGSSTLAMNKNFEVCKNDFHFDEKLCDFYIPLAHALFSPSTVFPLVAAAFYSSEYSGVPISPFQLLIVFILVIQLSVASPKVPGGIMATFTLLLNQLGLPLDAVGMLMVANVLCVNLDAALGMVIRDLDLMDIAL